MDNPGSIPSLPSRIASLVHTHFDGLPTRSKPTIYPDGSREWIPMSGIVIVKGESTPSEKLTCVAVTTGAKCLSTSQIPNGRGLVLHDWHAEILALRAFNYWLLSECHSFLAQEQKVRSSSPVDVSENNAIISPYIRRRRRSKTCNAAHLQSSTNSWPPFEFLPDIKIYMYCTCAPCGDASMELCMAVQDDPTPWEITTPDPQQTESLASPAPDLLDGRGYFSRLGIVRRKPSRADAESTKSKSCSDKLALRQVSSLLSYEASLLVAPTRNAYIEGIVLPEEEISRIACERCFSGTGRMKALNGRVWPESKDSDNDHDGNEEEPRYAYRFHPFNILSVPTQQIEALWPFAKPKPVPLPTPSETRTSPQATPRKSRPGNISAVWTVAPSFSHPGSIASDNGAKALPVLRGSKTGLYETILNGVKQGTRATSPTARGASALSRAKLWGFVRDIVQLSDVKDCASLENEVGNTEPNPGELIAPEPEDVLEHNNILRQLTTASTYHEFKKTPIASPYSVKARKTAIQEAKTILKGWTPNTGDEIWGLDVLIDPKKRKR